MGISVQSRANRPSSQTFLRRIVCEQPQADSESTGDLDCRFHCAGPFAGFEANKLTVIDACSLGQAVKAQARLLAQGAHLLSKAFAEVPGLALRPLLGDAFRFALAGRQSGNVAIIFGDNR
jgi:hypothetical protein